MFSTAPEPQGPPGNVALAPTAAAPQVGPAKRPDALGLLLALKRRWALALSLGVLCAAGAAAAIWYSLPTVYTGYVLVEVDTSAPVVFATAPSGEPASYDFQRAQAAIVKNRMLLNNALNMPKVRELAAVRDNPDAVEWVQGLIHADFAVAPNILRISMTGPDPETIRVIIEAVRDIYVKEVVQREQTLRAARLEELERVSDEFKTGLAAKRTRLKATTEDIGRNPRLMELHQKMALERLGGIQQDLSKLYRDLRQARLKAQADQARAKEAAKIPIADEAVEKEMAKDETLIGLAKKVADFELLMKEWDRTATAATKRASTKYKADLAASDKAKKDLAAHQKKLRPAVLAELQKVRKHQLEADLLIQQETIAGLQAWEKDLEGELEKHAELTKSMANRANNAEDLLRQIALADKIYDAIAEKIEYLKIERKAPDRVRRFEDNAVVSTPISKKMRFAGGGAAAAFGLVLFVITFWEFRTFKLTHPEELARGLRLPVVGSLPVLPDHVRRGRSRPGNHRDQYWRNLLTESVDSTRTMLLHAAGRESMQVIMVASALGGEGKTTFASHLVASLARAGRRVLLIDSDLRRPALHKVFNLPAHPGLSELLRGEVDLNGAVQAGPIPGLSVITAGQADMRAVQALSHGRLAPLFQQMKEQFDFVIVDSAPVLPVTDAQLIGQCVDGVILAVMREVSRLPAVKAACDRLCGLNIRLLGLVVNAASVASCYGHSSGYHYTTMPAQKSLPAPQPQSQQ